VTGPGTTAYTSTVVGRGHLCAGVVLGVVAALLVRPWEIGVLAGLVLVTAGWWLATVRLAVSDDALRVALGPLGRARRIPAADVAVAGTADLTRTQVLGLGLPWRARTTRLTVRPGPTLVVELRSGEMLRVSTPDPAAAAQLLGTPSRPEGEPS
jgi:hypothetical protein